MRTSCGCKRPVRDTCVASSKVCNSNVVADVFKLEGQDQRARERTLSRSEDATFESVDAAVGSGETTRQLPLTRDAFSFSAFEK